jgi:protein phosphatase
VKITIPELCLVILIGPSGSGKSTLARKHFKATEVLSSDFCRGLVSDDETDQTATIDAFDVLHFIAAKRLATGKLTVVDATNVQPEARKSLLTLAREYHVLPVAIVLNLPERLCLERNHQRPDREFGAHVVRQQHRQMRRSLRDLGKEGFRYVFVLSSPEEVEAVAVERQPLRTNLKHDYGPFDIIGDVHGCLDELVALLEKLGYRVGTLESSQVGMSEDLNLPNLQSANLQPANFSTFSHPQGRKAIFLGDLVDRGPKIPDVLRLVMSMVASGIALCVPGNHDIKLLRKLKGRNVQITHGLAESLAQLEPEPVEFKEQVVAFLDDLVSHHVLDDGKLVVAHAGMKTELQGRSSSRVRDFALFGETTGETDEFGLPVRYNWAAEYRGNALVVYGHTPIPEPEWVNRTINIDTGCVFGGKLTALRYPEKDLISVPAARAYYQPARPLLPAEQAPALSIQRENEDLLDIEDVLGKRIINTRLYRNITIQEENAIAALEIMSRFAANPKWLIYLPPTMSPSETTQESGLLEHPTEAFAYYRHQGIPRVVCEEKHMGSRAVVIVCRDEEATRKRFGVSDDGIGICYTRTGRRFFDNRELEAAFLARIRTALDTADIWEEFNTDWVCLDCELMPWSVKAQELLRQQYAAVGAASQAALAEVVPVLQRAAEQDEAIQELLSRYQQRAEMAAQYTSAYRRYCWPVNSLADLKLAPFHLLATEGEVHVSKDHLWHMETLAKLCRAAEDLLLTTPYKVVDVTDPTSQSDGIRWWEELTGGGGEGMVIKPLDFIAKGSRGLVQPAVKCRGREYLRIIYGPEYTAPENLERLRARGLSAKRSLALREFALGIEALERFVQREPLYRVHECVFGILALESEPVDPRL